jgi:hypothetical protein
VSVLAGYFPPVEPRCEEHMDATCWSCEGTGCRIEHPETIECKGCCDVCEGRGSGSWCYCPDCPDCRTADAYWRAYSDREDAARVRVYQRELVDEDVFTFHS